MSLFIVGLVLILLSALMAALARRWSAPAALGAAAGVLLVAFGFWSHGEEPTGRLLASDRVAAETAAAPAETNPAQETQSADAGNAVAPSPQATSGAPEEATGTPGSAQTATTANVADSGATPAQQDQPDGAEEAASEAAPDIPEHVIPGDAASWVAELAKLIEKPNHFPLTQSGDAPVGAPNEGDRIYEYINLQLAGRSLQTIFLSKSPDDPQTWMVHVEPGAEGLPIQPEELGRVRILGEGGNFVVFKIEDGPLAGNFLVWATGGHRGGGEAIRVYSPRFLEREQGLAEQIVRAAGE